MYINAPNCENVKIILVDTIPYLMRKLMKILQETKTSLFTFIYLWHLISDQVFSSFIIFIAMNFMNRVGTMRYCLSYQMFEQQKYLFYRKEKKCIFTLQSSNLFEQ